MEKRIEDYLHLYIGCQVLIEKEIDCSTNGEFPEYDEIAGSILPGIYKLVGVNTVKNSVMSGDVSLISKEGTACMTVFNNIKPLIRPLSDMTEEEREYCGWSETLCKKPIKHGNYESNEFIWLLKQGFDLFELIDAGLAINKTTHGE